MIKQTRFSLLMVTVACGLAAPLRAEKLFVFFGTGGAPAKGIYRAPFDTQTGKLGPAELAAEAGSPGGGYISIATYGPHAAKSQKLRAPYSWRSAEISKVLVWIPVTFEAAENEPILSGRSAWRSNSSRKWPAST